MRASRGRVGPVLVLGLVGALGSPSPAVPVARAPLLAPPVSAFLLPSSVVGGATTAHSHHAARTPTAPFPITYSYRVAVRAPASLAYTVEIYALALHAQRAAAGSRSSALPALPLAHPAIRGEWLRGVILDHYCALVVGAVYRNLLLSVNTADTYPGPRRSHGCRQDITTVLGVETQLLDRSQRFAAQH